MGKPAGTASGDVNDDAADDVLLGASNKQPQHPVETASWLSFATFWWMGPLMDLADKQGLVDADIPTIPSKERCNRNSDLLEQLWAREISLADINSNSRPSFGRVAWLYCRSRVLITTLIYIISLVLGFISPTILMKQIIFYAKTGSPANKYDGLIWISLLALCEIGRVFFLTLTWALSYRTAYRLKAASMGLVYRKVLRIGNLTGELSSKLLNLVSGDCGKLYEVIVFGQVAIGGPIVLLMSTIYIWLELGWLPLIGLSVFPLAYPLQYFLAKGSGSMKRKAVRVKDERVSLISQVIQHFKFLKMFAWENYLYKTISDVRDREHKYLVKSQLLQSFSVVLGPSLPHVALILTFLLYITTGKSLLPAQAFCITAVYTGRIRPTFSRIRTGLRAWFEAEIAIPRIQAFTILFIFSLLFFSIRMLTQLYDCWYSFGICCERMKSLLTLPELKDTTRNVCDSNHADVDEALVFEDLNLTRREYLDVNNKPTKAKRKSNKDTKDVNSIERLLGNSESSSSSENMAFHLGPITLHIKKGSFVGVCGYVGSGKTTLLETIAGSLTTEKGLLNVFGRTAYVPQQPWLFRGTIRENIVFGEEFDSVKYYNCIESCCLVNDFGTLPLGDLTRVENNGSNLSGGQRQRISLARALYYQSGDIYLLDDPLSGLDNRVAKAIFENAIVNKLVKQKKTVLLVTHQLNYLKDCDEILVLSDGKIAENGRHEDLVARNGSPYATLWNSVLQSKNGNDDRHEEDSLDSDSDILDLKIDEATVSNAKKMQIELEKARKDVSPEVYSLYLKSAGGWLALVIILIVFSISAGSTTFSSWWLKQWFSSGATVPSHDIVTFNVTDSENGTSVESTPTIMPDEYISNTSPNFVFYRNTYAAVIGVIFIASLCRTIFFVMATTKAGKILHRKILQQFFRSRLKTVERLGSGQVFNLFARDVDEVDGSLPSNMENFLQNVFIILSVLTLVSIVFPQFLLFAGLMFLVFVVYRKIYNAAIRDIKRIESRRRTPIFNRISETVQGLGTIRAFNKERLMTHEFEKLTDASTSVSYTFSASVRWLSIRLDILAVTMTSAVAVLIFVFHGAISAAAAGLALSYAAQLSGVFQFTVRLASETEAKFVSVERMQTFLSYDQNEKIAVGESGNHQLSPDDDGMMMPEPGIHPNWPTAGHVKFDAVTLTYSSNDPPVLRDVCFEVQSGQNIGIIGRTGSGKSSLGNALFRLTELKSGSISIDGVNISALPLHKLRNAMCVISQEPCVFHKTIRYNLDAGKLYQDHELWAVLEKTGLKSAVDNLDSEIGLSHGQKQLLCIARAILRQSKILFVDEATSNMDAETAAIVEKLLAEEFKYSTIFIVAHRTSALASCDYVLMMDDGEVRDFGPVDIISRKPEFKRSFENFETVLME